MVRATRIGYSVLSTLCLLWLAACEPPPVEPNYRYHSREHLIEAHALKALIGTDLEPVVLDVRKPAQYSKGHIINAINIWRPAYTSEDYPFGGMRPTADQLAASLSARGLEPTDHIVVYDDCANGDAARLWWVLKLYGHTNVTILTGGLKTWTYLRFPITTDIPVPKPSAYLFSSLPDEHLLAKLDQAVNAVKNKDCVLLDTRMETEFTGELQKPGAFRAGHIPGAIHIDYMECVDEQHCFKPVDVLRELFESRGVTADKKVIVYCQSGARSAQVTFVLTELLGYSNVVNYDGSWIEWSYHPELPLETGLPKSPAH